MQITLSAAEEKELSKLLSDCVWEVTDGGQKIDPERFLTYQDEPITSFEVLTKWICSQKNQTRVTPTEVNDLLGNGIALIKYNSVYVKAEYINDNLTDLANAYAQMGFVCKMTKEELMTNIENVIDEQYLQSILNANKK